MTFWVGVLLVAVFGSGVGSASESDTVEPMRFLAVTILVLAMLASSLFVSVAVAQDGDGPTILPVPQSESETQGTEAIDYDANQAGIDRARRILIAIAVVMSLGLIGYWWHTVPSRRWRVATKRLAQHRARTSPVASEPPFVPNSRAEPSSRAASETLVAPESESQATIRVPKSKPIKAESDGA